jgi:hypothetical protein
MVLSGKLVDMGNGSTEVTNKMDISVTGKLAQFGSRMIDDVSDQVFKQFVNNFRNQLQVAVSTDPAKPPDEAPPAAEAKPLNAVSLFFSMIWASIQKLFGKTPGD